MAACAEPAGRGLRWPWTDFRPGAAQGGGLYMAGWCNGSAGYVFLWTLAHRAHRARGDRGGGGWLELAERAAWDVWEAREGPANLCCGSAGGAYALLDLHRATGDGAWLGRAHKLARCAARRVDQLQEFPDSLYKGELGLALLACELERPEEARLPVFERED